MSRSALLAAVAILGSAAATKAETLADAIALAYSTNPQLVAARATQRALDETYVQARAGWGPTIGLTGEAYWQHTAYGAESSNVLSSTSIGAGVTGVGTAGATTTGASNAGSTGSGPGTTASEATSGVAVQGTDASNLNYGYAALTVTQPLYTGGKVAAEVQAADAAVRAGRQSLHATETNVLQAVVTAYEDVLRDAAILRVRQEAVQVLAAQSDEAAAKFKVGQANRVDTSQAQAQLAAAQALVAGARAQLAISRAGYVSAVGQSPGELSEPAPLPGLPATVDAAFDAAEAGSPPLLQAQLTEAASRARIAAARANLRPTVALQASYGAEGTLVPFATRDFDRVATGEVVFSQPIFTAGLNGSLVRQALAQNTADRVSIETVRRNVVEQVSQAWETLAGARTSLQSDLTGLQAAQTAFGGIREEYRVGLSSTLDVLIQQQTLESAELSVVAARHDAYVAGAMLLAATGRLQAADLVQDQPVYDPGRAFDRVKRKDATPWEPLVAAVDQIGEPSLEGGKAPSVAEPIKPVLRSDLPSGELDRNPR